MMVWLNSHAGLWGKPLTPGLRGPASESGIMIIACLSPFLFFPFFFWEDFCFYSPAKRIDTFGAFKFGILFTSGTPPRKDIGSGLLTSDMGFWQCTPSLRSPSPSLSSQENYLRPP